MAIAQEDFKKGLLRLVNYVEMFLQAQGKRCEVEYSKSTTSSADIYYIHEDKCCAIGCLMSPEYYSRVIEGVGIDTILRYYGYNIISDKLQKFEISPEALDEEQKMELIELLVKLQITHDTLPIGDWPKEFMKIRTFIQEGNLRAINA
jgi:hypothetical protein